MGVEHNNAVIATTYDSDEVKRVKKWIDGLQDHFVQSLFVVGAKVINNKRTIVMMPDGSKEGWPESEKGDSMRDEFINLLKQADFDDGSSPWKWIEVGYGECGQELLRGNCKNLYC